MTTDNETKLKLQNDDVYKRDTSTFRICCLGCSTEPRCGFPFCRILPRPTIEVYRRYCGIVWPKHPLTDGVPANSAAQYVSLSPARKDCWSIRLVYTFPERQFFVRCGVSREGRLRDLRYYPYHSTCLLHCSAVQISIADFHAYAVCPDAVSCVRFENVRCGSFA